MVRLVATIEDVEVMSSVLNTQRVLCAWGIWTPDLSISKFLAHPVYAGTCCSVPKTLNRLENYGLMDENVKCIYDVHTECTIMN